MNAGLCKFVLPVTFKIPIFAVFITVNLVVFTLLNNPVYDTTMLFAKR